MMPVSVWSHSPVIPGAGEVRGRPGGGGPAITDTGAFQVVVLAVQGKFGNPEKTGSFTGPGICLSPAFQRNNSPFFEALNKTGIAL
jgi:hypothetical protein